MRPRLRRASTTGAVLLMTATTACGGDVDPPSGDPAFSRSDSAGVELAVTTPPDSPTATGWTIGAEPAVVFGETGPDPVEFFRLDDATRLDDGRVVALDAGTRQLLYFDAAGDLVTTVGREGDGPGEFQRPGGIARLPGDTIVVYAQRHQRLSLFDDDGTWLEDRRLEVGEELRPWLNYRISDATDGAVTLTAFGWVISTMEGETPSDRTVDNPQLRFATDGTFLGEVAEPNTIWLYASGGELYSELFRGSRTAAAAGGRVYVRDAGAYEVRVYAPDGSLERIHRLQRARRPTSGDDVERYREHMRDVIENPETLTRVLERIDRQPRADSFPSTGNLHVDARGDIWVTEYLPPWEERDVTAVFAADGPWLGTVEMPADFRPFEIGEDYLLGVRTDELDVQHLVLYELERPS